MFISPFKNNKKIEETSQVIFVSDMFVDEYVGGAELTTEALIEACPFKYQKFKSADLNLQLLEQGHRCFWVFGNFANMNRELIPTIVANLDYSVLEYDYKYCKYRSPEKHKHAELVDCDCHHQMHGKMISAFYFGSKSLWWMSEGQEEIYQTHFPFLKEKESTVLSSVFNDQYFATVRILNEKYKDSDRSGWIVLGSNSWIKGAKAAEDYCLENDLEYEVVWDIPYDEVLEKLAQSEGFVYLPSGMDTCPRMVIEAKMLGCKLVLNDNVQHKNEIWFDTEDTFDTEAYLYAAREKFWSSIKNSMEWNPTVSGYTTTKDCISQNYPWQQCIESMLGFADEVVVVDGGSTDGTWEKLLEWSESLKDKKLKVFKVERDWSHPRHAVFDGLQKAEARSRCTSDFLWQMDADEIVHEEDYEKIVGLCKNFPAQADLVSLPVIEYWGSIEKIRCDINPWKWRLSRNKDYITHGIPIDLRQTDVNGELFASMGTDGCDYVHKDNGQRIPHASFYTAEVDKVRRAAVGGHEEALENYSVWFNNLVNLLPGVHHYSWFDLERKIKTYKNYWQRHWESLYDIKQEDIAENNMFFTKKWSEVTDEDISGLADKLRTEMGGWVFHSRVDFSRPTPHVVLNRKQPQIMSDDEQ